LPRKHLKKENAMWLRAFRENKPKHAFCAAESSPRKHSKSENTPFVRRRAFQENTPKVKTRLLRTCITCIASVHAAFAGFPPSVYAFFGCAAMKFVRVLSAVPYGDLICLSGCKQNVSVALQTAAVGEE